MKSVPRILPLVGVAIGGVLALNAMAGARDLPGLLTGARAYAEEAVTSGKAAPPPKPTSASGSSGEGAATGEAKDTAALSPPGIAPKAVCAPTAAELAKQAGLSPAELQILQSLGQRRGQLDQRESDMSTQIALLAAAEAKLDAKMRMMSGLKAEVQGLLSQSNAKEAAEIDRLVKVFEGMKAKDSAPRMVLLDDSVRLPIAAKMKERALSAIIAQMPALEAKRLTEALARRFSDAQAAAAKASAIAAAPPAAVATQTSPDPIKTESPTAKRPAARKRAPASQRAASNKAAPSAPSPAAATDSPEPPPAAKAG